MMSERWEGDDGGEEASQGVWIGPNRLNEMRQTRVQMPQPAVPAPHSRAARCGSFRPRRTPLATRRRRAPYVSPPTKGMREVRPWSAAAVAPYRPPRGSASQPPWHPRGGCQTGRRARGGSPDWQRGWTVRRGARSFLQRRDEGHLGGPPVATTERCERKTLFRLTLVKP